MKLLFSKPKIQSIGANRHIKIQLNSLTIEKEILTKTIARLYQHDMDLSKIQKDRLLIRYQHQLGIVLAKIEKLEAASKHPDLGPLGDGLITLMDQKLSQLDKRLYEISSKISVSNIQSPDTKPKIEEITKSKEVKKIETSSQIPKPSTPTPPSPQQNQKKLEITTLTELPSKILEFPVFEQKPREIQMEIIQERLEKQPNVEEKIQDIKINDISPEIKKPEIKTELSKQETIQEPVQKPKPSVKLPAEENIEDEDDDLDKIKGEIMKTLSKLEQAEVE